MDKLIVYQDQESKYLAIVVPFLGCGLSIDEIAKKDVPTGIRYKIIDRSSAPSQSMLLSECTIDFSTFDGVGL